MSELDRQAFDLGWDFATFGVEVPENAKNDFCDGYRAFQHGKTRSTHSPDKYVRKWLQIRFGALARGKRFSLDISPEYIAKITPASGKCPITEEPFTYSAGAPTDWSVDRANNNRGYVRGNILIMNQAANSAKGDKSLDEVRILANGDISQYGLSPSQWEKLAQLIEPAFGDEVDEISPIQVLLGQPIALGMPVSPVASFQVAVSRAAIDSWTPQKEELMLNYLFVLEKCICTNKKHVKTLHRLLREVMRRSTHTKSYWEIWATPRVQKRLMSFLESLGRTGLEKLVSLQDFTVGSENTKIV